MRFGRRFGVVAYGVCVIGALMLSGLLGVGLFGTDMHLWAAVPLGLLPLTLRPIRTMATTTDPERLNPLLGATGRILLLWAVLFAIGWNL